MNIILKSIAFTAVVGSCSLFAETNPSACFEVGAALLYWKTCSPSFHYASTFSDVGTKGDIQSVEAGWDFGFRVKAAYSTPCYFVRLDGTFFSHTDSPPKISTPIAPNPLAAPFTLTFFPRADLTMAGTSSTLQAVVDRAKGHMKNEYYRVNLRLGYYLHQGCSLDYYTYAGIRWIDIHQRRRMAASRPTFTVQQIQIDAAVYAFSESAEFNGAGIELGIGGAYHIGCGFDLVGHVGGLAAIGRQTLRAETDTSLEFASEVLRDHSVADCTGGIELRLGFARTCCCRCFKLSGEIGYELNYYLTPLEVLELTPTFGLAFASINIAYAGPYATLRVSF